MSMRVRKNAPIRTAMIRTKVSKWPHFMRMHALEILRTVRGRKIAAAMKLRKRGAKIKLVDLMLEVPVSVEDL